MKEFILAKSNLKKSKSLVFGLTLLIFLATAFLNIVLITFSDYQKDPIRQAEKLETEDAMIAVTLADSNSDIDYKYIESITNKNEVNKFEIENDLSAQSELKYGDGTVTTTIFFKKNGINEKIGKTEIVEEDVSITKDYIYLPYQFHSGGKLNIGEDYKIKILNNSYNFKIKGFVNNIGIGSFNAGGIATIISEESYNKIYEDNGYLVKSTLIKFDLKDNVNADKFANKLMTKIMSDKQVIASEVFDLDTIIFARTFISMILGVSFLVVSFIVIVIVLLMLSNSISNYIKENIKTIGALKSLGYTSKNIKLSFIIQFFLLTVIGTIIGIVVSYLFLPILADIMVSQSGIPYTVSFNPMCTLISFIILIVVVLLAVLFFTRKIKEIEPIIALRDNINTHNFKKNKVKLEKSILPINLSLALKNMFTNKRQHIATFIITLFLVFAGVISLVMYQNFSKEPKISILAFEITSGIVEVSGEKTYEVRDYLKSLDGVHNVREVTMTGLFADDIRLLSYVLDNSDNLKNQDVCYKGRLPKYDNEIAVSGKFAENENYHIGDNIEIKKGELKEKYIITGFIQTTNNMGHEAVILDRGVEKISDANRAKMYYYDVDEGIDIDKINDKIKDMYGDNIYQTMNFEELIKGSTSTFITISNTMVVVMLSISAIVILLVLYLLIKTLINNKKKDYGILKAIGYTSNNIILQNSVSFMPSITMSVILSCIISSVIANPYLQTIMKLFGIMKLNFTIPVGLIIVMGIGFIVVSFIVTILLSLKIKKIEPYNLLKGE